MIAPSDIASAEQRYLIPVIGQSLYDVMMGGAYPTLLDDYVAPAIAEYVREVVDAPSAPASAKGVRRARTMMIRLSRHLDDNEQLYPEYCSSDNI